MGQKCSIHSIWIVQRKVKVIIRDASALENVKLFLREPQAEPEFFMGAIESLVCQNQLYILVL
jgi:hypothetical protein